MKRVVLLAPLALISACAGGQSRVADSAILQVVRNEPLPPPSAFDMTPADIPYVLGPLDKVRVTVFGLGELSGDNMQIDAGGQLGVPLAGAVQASGRTPAQLADAIAARLREKRVRNPQVSVTVLDTVSRVFTVEGEVRDPGIFPVEGNLTLLRAVAKAKGLNEFGRNNDVLVFRTVGDRRMVGVYDLRALRDGVYADPAIYANDLVVVGDSPSRRTLKTLVEGAALLSPLVILLN